ncbi:hypothetical protein ACFWR9_16570 [Streptomyces sp. NPDC058534]|uniref:hypothetical protein n=1 Tax=Streptomyces sp. NPDC058534 TaxID=3346541 RepID=UPI0036556020
MEIEVLVVPGCPNQQRAEELLRQALDDAWLAGTGFTTRMISGPADKEDLVRDGRS